MRQISTLFFFFTWNNYLYISSNISIKYSLHFPLHSHKCLPQTSKQLPRLNFHLLRKAYLQQLSLSLSSSFHYSHGLTILPSKLIIKASRKFEKGKEEEEKRRNRKNNRKRRGTGLHKSVEVIVDERKLNCTSNILKRRYLLTSLDNSKLSN